MENIQDINKAIAELSKRDISDMDLVYKDSFLNNLNHEQRVAATRKEGNYLVIAGPGSGKTHTLAYRVVYLVKQGIDPLSLVVITFTRKAGKELKDRINYLLPNTSLGFVGTFHAFSHHISSKLGNSSPISGFRLLDSEDDIQVHKLVMADFKNFNKKIAASRLQKILSYCDNTMLTVEEYIHQFDLHNLKPDIENIEAYKEKYQSYKARHLLASYDDMIRLVSRYLEKNGSKKVTASFDYLMVDEYQDTNKMQLDFIKRLNIDNVMAIGDDFQGIYAFRGADHRIILNFINDFKDAQMIKLKDNYRSSGEVVDYVNKTVERSTLGYHKQFRVVKKDKGLAEVVAGKSLEEHKLFILNQIKENPKKTHALIYRYNKNRTAYEKAFIEEGIEYSVYGGIRLLERKHIKDVMAFLMVYLNNLDVVSFNRILTLLPGIGPKTARKLIDTRLKDLKSVPLSKRHELEKIKEILECREEKEILFQRICNFYFDIYEHVESTVYSQDEIRDDFKLIRELMSTYSSLDNFVINLILDPVIDMHKGKKPRVVLSTIHSAKGLEFDNVYYFHTHDWYKNFDIERLEEDRRLFYVGISRAKDKLYVFDHTGYSRTFDEILRDFDNISSIQAPEEVYESKTEDSYDPSYFEWIDGQKYDMTLPTIGHQNCLTALSSEFYMALKGMTDKSFLGPLKVRLQRKDKDEFSFVQPDLFVLEDMTLSDEVYIHPPKLVVEVITSDTRSKDMVKKMDLYMNTGIREYWIIDADTRMVMVYAFENYLMKGTQIFMAGEVIKSGLYKSLEIHVNDIIN
ncbi:hypothetical protein EZV73_03335 [Acidaminobacter sp. JC074]|uniref:UvrD-helicase domain-containing protein n=1 Tax=Acidaminobacter sp. JC074 TaxID=2530199 RepID=UPI001F0E8673|nr:UvrD-helicase domain-containing protein [Acidaminobacter sp. JC074]MCH4886583.1 hypothetical protein [Acidaminobacter sp. JC074]